MLPKAVAAVHETSEPASTLQTLPRLRLAREQRGPVPAWMADLEYELEQAAAPTGRSTFGED